MDLRYRQRYVDLIVNPEVKSVFITRAKIIKAIREYMSNLGYLEVETPVLHNQATNANARPFCTHQNTLDIDMYLRIELELNLKKLIVGGLDKIFEIGKVFRNEGMDTRHNPEFTLMEFYEAYGDLYTMMDRAEQIYCYVADNVLGTLQIDFQGQIINLESPWRGLL
jgi:lysyl-tRNA synthetase class 2